MKYLRIVPLGFKDIIIKKFEVMVKTQILCAKLSYLNLVSLIAINKLQHQLFKFLFRFLVSFPVHNTCLKLKLS